MARGTRQLLVVGPCVLHSSRRESTSWHTRQTTRLVASGNREGETTVPHCGVNCRPQVLPGRSHSARLSSQSQVQTATQRKQVSCRARRLLPRSGVAFHHPQATTTAAFEQQSGTKNLSMLHWNGACPGCQEPGDGPGPRALFNADGDAAALGSPAVGVGASRLRYQKRAGLNTRSPHRPNTRRGGLLADGNLHSIN